MSRQISLNRNIYPDWAVARAAADYQALASIKITADGGYLLCSFRNCKYDEALTVREFLNYLVNLLNSSGLS